MSLRAVSSLSKARRRCCRLLASLFLLIGVGPLSSLAASESPRNDRAVTELEADSLPIVCGAAADISTASHNDSDWRAIRRMPATVLEILEQCLHGKK